MRLLLLALALAACGSDPDLTTTADTGELRATCGFDGVCDPAFRWFRFDGDPVQLELVFTSAVTSDTDAGALRAHFEVATVTFTPGFIPEPPGVRECGQAPPIPELEAFTGGRLRGRVDGAVRRCRLVDGDILDDTGVEPVTFGFAFDLAFDPAATPVP